MKINSNGKVVWSFTKFSQLILNISFKFEYLLWNPENREHQKRVWNGFSKKVGQKIFPQSQNLGSIHDRSQNLVFGWFCILESQIFFVSVLNVDSQGLTVSQSLELTILYS